MFLYCTPYAPISDFAPYLSLMPPARRARFDRAPSGSTGPLFAYALLALALERHFAVSSQEIRFTDRGKPFLSGEAAHLSLSHCKTHALCAVSSLPVGCDIETHRPVLRRTVDRVLAGTERESDFFAYWTFKESYLKLTGAFGQAFSSIAFDLIDGRATGPNCQGFSYPINPDCTAAVLAKAPFPRPVLHMLTPEELFSYALEKWA